MLHFNQMKNFEWDNEKNERLKSSRGVSFEAIVFCIEKGFLLDIATHADQVKYPGQKIFIVELDNYAYLIPFVETDEMIHLKTIIPSRKATKRYLGREEK